LDPASRGPPLESRDWPRAAANRVFCGAKGSTVMTIDGAAGRIFVPPDCRLHLQPGTDRPGTPL